MNKLSVDVYESYNLKSLLILTAPQQQHQQQGANQQPGQSIPQTQHPQTPLENNQQQQQQELPEILNSVVNSGYGKNFPVAVHNGRQNSLPSNIPSHNVQSHVYQQPPPAPQTQPQFNQFIPHAAAGPVTSGGNYYVMSHIPNALYFSNFTANVNVHGYTQTMQQPYMSANAQTFVPAENHQSQVEQV